MREVTIPPNWTYLVQCSSQRSATENIDLKDTWFSIDLDKYPVKTPCHEPIIALENSNKTLTPSQSESHAHEGTSSKGASDSEVDEHTSSEVVQNTSNLKNFHFVQKSFNAPSGIPYCEGDKGGKGSKILKMIYLASTGLRRYARLANKPPKKRFIG